MNNLPATTKDALIAQFNSLHAEFMDAAKASEPLLVAQVAKASAMGIVLKEILGCEAVTRSRLAGWLETNAGRLAETHIDWLMNYVSVSNKIGPEQMKFSDVPRPVVQMVFQCAGILPEITGREVEQQSRELSPATSAWKFRGDLEAHFGKLFKTVSDWDQRQKQSVRTEIEKAKTYLEELEAKL